MVFHPRHPKRTFLAAAATGIVGLLAAFPVLAQVDLGLEQTQATGLATGDIRSTIAGIIRVFLGLLGIVAVILIMYAGWLWMTAQGEEEKVGTAKRILTQAVIGLVIILSSYAIATFILNAITGSTPGMSGGGCPPGQTCSSGGFGSSGSGFRVKGIVPSGPGPGNRGWPKNYSLTIGFSAGVDQATVTDASVRVEQCNRRVNGSGEAQPFKFADCGTAVNGTRTVDGNIIRFKPNQADTPVDFDGDFWYLVKLFNGQSGLKSAPGGKILICPQPLVGGNDYSAPVDGSCIAAVAINDLRDVEPPTVRIISPSSPPKSCGIPTPLPVNIEAKDDFLVADVSVQLNGGFAGLVNALGEPYDALNPPVAVNAGFNDPFVSSDIYIDFTKLTAGAAYTISAVAHDGVPQASTEATQILEMAPAHCCNGVAQPESPYFELGIDCGGAASGCGFCTGTSCTLNKECNSGSCARFCSNDPAISCTDAADCGGEACGPGQCISRPIINEVNAGTGHEWDGGPGTYVTLKGLHFGSRAGAVVFLGNPNDSNDDTTAQACAPGAWKDTEVVVPVPQGAAEGSLRLIASDGRYDDTTAGSPPGVEGEFDPTGPARPGICYVDPVGGIVGAPFVIHGASFGPTMGDAPNQSFAKVGSTVAGIKNGEWTASVVTAFVPSITEGLYPVRLWIGGSATPTNEVTFAVRAAAGETNPVISEITPAKGQTGQYVTILGSGFGTRAGVVKFFKGLPGNPNTEVAPALDKLVCDDSWHDNYVVVKVPTEYLAGLGGGQVGTVQQGLHHVRIETASPTKNSNLVDFTVNTDPLTPALCSLTPNNGPPGTLVTVSGEGFDQKNQKQWSLVEPLYTIDFYDGRDASGTILTMIAENYSRWSNTEVTAMVPGDLSVPANWPKTGPVRVTAENVQSANAIPFKVGDCNQPSAACSAGTICCVVDGVCKEPTAECGPTSHDSAYGWVFSTETLPSLPRVVERAQCSATAVQSPSPFKDSTDACLNSLIDVEISRAIDPDSVTTSTFLVVACATDDAGAADCATSTPVDVVIVPPDLSNPSNPSSVMPSADGGSVLFVPPKFGFAKNTWYRVTLVSDPTSGTGIVDAVNGQYLDGNNDRIQGGNYVYLFRTRDSDEACELSRVNVTPSAHTIVRQGTPPSAFRATMMAANCNPLECFDVSETPEKPLYNMQWSTPDTAPATRVLILPDSTAGSCLEQLSVTAERETVAGTTVPLAVDVSAIDNPLKLTKSGASAVTVAFTDPVVTERFPDCDEACVDALIGANFNVAMDEESLSDVNIDLFRCRNASCNPPWATDGVPSIGVVQPVSRTVGQITGFTFSVTGKMLPSSYYKVVLYGDDPTTTTNIEGIKSASGVALTGLNEGNTYSWIFHTKSDSTPCVPYRATIDPKDIRMSYIGQRQDVLTTPYSAPDACSATGQRLAADPRAWTWNRALDQTNGAKWENSADLLNGFLKTGLNGFWSIVDVEPMDTKITRPVGCSNNCLLTGSQNTRPQCGNGIEEKGEECEKPFAASCDPMTCLWKGAAGVSAGGTCGDDDPNDPGEECDSTGGVFPPGCSDPATTGAGCLLQGSSFAPNSTCGDGAIGDGEACDDGNRSNGDGCSADCLMEGSLPSCDPSINVSGGACVNFCGNGIVEPGEDEACEDADGPTANGCDPARCVLLGTPRCSPPVGGIYPPDCCGNGEVDDGEDDGCDVTAGAPLAEGCSDRCILKGSSYAYSSPSFCGDGIVGTGERAVCEASDINGDDNIDAYQGYQVGPFSGANIATTKLTATLATISPTNVGKANVTLSCTCKLPGVDGPAYCAAIADGANPSLGYPLSCNDQGCCAQAPEIVQPTYPVNENNVCRNTVVRVEFTQAMDASTMEQGFLVGVSTPTGPCSSAGALLATASSADGGSAHPSLFRRTWNAIAGFFRSLFGADAVASAPGSAPPPSEQYCLVQGSVAVSGAVATWSPKEALLPDTWYRVVIVGDDKNFAVKSVTKAPLAATEDFYFGTGTDICTIDRVIVEPSSQLFTTAEDLGIVSPGPDDVDGDQEFTARAHPKGRPPEAEISSIAGVYEFAWAWDAQVAESVIELSAALGAPSANVNVRNTGTGFPHDGTAVVRVTADVTEGGVVTASIPGTADVTVLLCENPWPARRLCTDNRLEWRNKDGDLQQGLPWDPAATCNTNGPYWSPFYDPATHISFYYCRDAGAGDEGNLLPIMDENLIKVQPGGNILREYLFPMDNGDAVGLRISKNLKHLAIADWYAAQGFLGRPQQSEVDGYAAVQEGRTTYVNTATLSPPHLYTNVNILSYSNSAKPETVAVYNQLLKNFDLNDNITDLGYCVGSDGKQVLFDPDHANDVSGDYRYGFTAVQETDEDGKPIGVPAAPVACSADLDCWVHPTTGEALPNGFYTDAPDYREAFRCAAPKEKLVRDVNRWGNMHQIRDTLLSKTSYPTLEAGTFLRSRTTSAWDSWATVLGAGLGSSLPSDPLNAHAYCSNATATEENGFDLTSCWDDGDKVYQCSAGSHIYGYQSIGGKDFLLAMDFETNCAVYASQGQCESFSPVCVWDASASSECPESTLCGDFIVGIGETCDDGNFVSGDGCSSACQIEGGGEPEPPCVPSTAGFCKATAAWGGDTPETCLEFESASCGTALGKVCSNDPKKSCTIAAECGSGTCESQCAWNPVGYCTYRFGAALLGGVAPGMSQCQDAILGAAGICGDGIVNNNDDDQLNEECEPGVAIAPESCPLDGRIGIKQDTCTLSCKRVAGVCQTGVCGDGVVQSPEVCDDGSLNGGYGKCKPDCSGSGFFCGDDKLQPSEACDCGARNGIYVQNGTKQTPSQKDCTVGGISAPSCSWDCRDAGPRCGDGIVNAANEKCDTETQTSRGYCNDSDKSPCASTADCPVPSGKVCQIALWLACTTDNDCEGTPCIAQQPLCGNIPSEPERSNIRVCKGQEAGSASCTWGNWTLTAPGECGNGIKETGEECDEVTLDSRYGDAGACVMDIGRRACKINVCGDGYLNSADGEQCDDGSKNGVACKPEYGRDCNYCSGSCKVVTLSGGFCGDGKIQDAAANPPGPEQCEPTNPQPTDWICRASWQGFKSWGFNLGKASCAASTCRFYCPYLDTNLCLNTPDGGNIDQDEGDGFFADKTLNLTSDAYGLNLTTGSTRVKLPNGKNVYATSLVSLLYNQCDYDMDGDGVPNAYDCSPSDANVHQEYSFTTYVNPFDSNDVDRIVIPAAGTCPGGTVAPASAPGPFCGDGACNGDEVCDSGFGNTKTCKEDCGVCGSGSEGPYCGDGICNGDETPEVGSCYDRSYQGGCIDCGWCSGCGGTTNPDGTTSCGGPVLTEKP